MQDNLTVLLMISSVGAIILVIFFLVIFNKHQTRLIRKRTELQEVKIQHQQQLLETVVLSQENERKRIGQDLHDEVGSALAQLRLVIEMFRHQKASTIYEFSGNCKNLIDKIIDDTRNISHNLSPTGLLENGLVLSLEENCQPIVKAGVLNINIIDDTNGKIDHLSQLESISLYRLIIELIQNTIKHANAQNAKLNISIENKHFIFHYNDDGIGLQPNQKNGMGTQNIAQRLAVIGAEAIPQTQQAKGYHFAFSLQNHEN